MTAPTENSCADLRNVGQPRRDSNPQPSDPYRTSLNARDIPSTLKFWRSGRSVESNRVHRGGAATARQGGEVGEHGVDVGDSARVTGSRRAPHPDSERITVNPGAQASADLRTHPNLCRGHADATGHDPSCDPGGRPRQLGRRRLDARRLRSGRVARHLTRGLATPHRPRDATPSLRRTDVGLLTLTQNCVRLLRLLTRLAKHHQNAPKEVAGLAD